MKCLQKIKSAFHLSLPNITAITKANRPALPRHGAAASPSTCYSNTNKRFSSAADRSEAALRNTAQIKNREKKKELKNNWEKKAS